MITLRSSTPIARKAHKCGWCARGNLDRHGVHFLTAYVAGV